MQLPKVSIIVPCYNQADYLPEALGSVLQQTCEQWECIVVNDGSEDTTEEVAQQWVKKDARFKYINIPNGGLSNARNTGIEAASGIYILPLDSDDKLGENYLELALDAFNNEPELKVVYCNAEKFGVENKPWKLKEFSLKQLAISNVIFCSALFRKKDWETAGGYDILMRYGWEDWEFWIALLKNGGKVKKLDYVGFYYRTKNQSMIKNLTDENQNELYKYLSIKHAEFFVKELGSFHELVKEHYLLKKEYSALRSSKKQAINVLCYFFFKWKPFKLKNQT